MGSRTDASIAAWQKQAGIEQAQGARAETLATITEMALSLIQIVALEHSGIRDGDGRWHGSDPLNGTVRKIVEQSERLNGAAPTATPHECFGGCPECGKNDGYLNNDADHWFFCNTHLTTWLAGSNLFSSWLDMTEQEAADQRYKLTKYRVVEPIYPEPTKEEKAEQARVNAEYDRLDKGHGVVWLNSTPRVLEPGEDLPF